MFCMHLSLSTNSRKSASAAVSAAAFTSVLISLFYRRTDDIGLPPFLNLVKYKLICSRSVCRSYHTVFNRYPALGALCNHGNVHVAVHNDSEGTRYRRCTHDQCMRHISFIRQSLSLPHSEAMLFIGNYKTQCVILNTVLKQSMCAYDYIGLMCPDAS